MRRIPLGRRHTALCSLVASCVLVAALEQNVSPLFRVPNLREWRAHRLRTPTPVEWVDQSVAKAEAWLRQLNDEAASGMYRASLAGAELFAVPRAPGRPMGNHTARRVLFLFLTLF
jgi:hypothetical protein